jgi:recombinational DNA repair protein RecR
MAYTPEMTMKSSRALRRIAWALDMPMTKAMEKVFEYLSEILDNKKVCKACRDKSKCSDCQFNFQARIHEENEMKGSDSVKPKI